jgi:inhibitor of the pro-sigma K processing machinery
MKIVLAIILAVSLLLLLYTVLKYRLTWRWLRVFSVQVIVAAAAIYAINYSGFFSGLHIPLNPTTMATAVLLGVPGVVLMVCLKLTLI